MVYKNINAGVFFFTVNCNLNTLNLEITHIYIIDFALILSSIIRILLFSNAHVVAKLDKTCRK